MVLSLAFLFGLSLCFLWAYIGVFLWNYVMPTIFGLPQINYWQMLALLFLIRFVFPTSININKGD